MVLIGLAGPSGAGKTVFSEKVANFMPDVCIISMDNYNDASRVIDGNYDGKHLVSWHYIQLPFHLAIHCASWTVCKLDIVPARHCAS